MWIMWTYILFFGYDINYLSYLNIHFERYSRELQGSHMVKMIILFVLYFMSQKEEMTGATRGPTYLVIIS
jgi:hypothetical protein